MKPVDELLQRYREANALDPARPGPAVRENVLARARTAAQSVRAPGTERPAANDPAWRWRALGGLAVLGLATLVVLQFDRGYPQEREVALGETHLPRRDSANADNTRAPGVAQDPTPSTPPKRHEQKTRPAPPPPAPASPPSAPTAPATAASPAPETASRADAAPGAAGAPGNADRAREEAPASLSARRAAAPVLRSSPTDANALAAAAARGDAAAAREALAHGADVNSADGRGRTALMLAAQRGDATLLRLLLDAGADPSLTDLEGLRAADLARKAGHEAAAQLLAPAGPR